MSFFEWSDRFSVNLEEMDRQHRKFFEMLNRLQEYNRRSERDPAFLDELFRDLAAYVLTHFADEEALLEQTGYGGLDLQKRQHAFFKEQLIELRKKHLAGERRLPESVLDFLRDWLLNHILEIDMKYADYFKHP